MWYILATLVAIAMGWSSTSPPSTPQPLSFKKEQIIFSSNFNITRIIVPSDGSSSFIHTANSGDNVPSIFFTISDPKLNGGTCIYVLEDFAAYEVLEGGRDTTTDYSQDRTIYFGAKDGIYKYDHRSLSAKKYDVFSNDIIQIQKAKGLDRIYILTKTGQLLFIENNGTKSSKVSHVVCAKQFVLDTSNNLYYVQCGDQMIHIINSDGDKLNITASVMEEFEEVMLLRPAFIMDQCIPFLGDGVLHILYANGVYEKRDFKMPMSSIVSVDAAVYITAAFEGKIYEFNVMEVLLESLFEVGATTTTSLSILYNNLISVMDDSKGGLVEFYKSVNGYHRFK